MRTLLAKLLIFGAEILASTWFRILATVIALYISSYWIWFLVSVPFKWMFR